MKKKSRKKIFLVFLPLILIIIYSLLSSYDFKSYAGLTIDEVLEKKYKKHSCTYIETNNYYYIVGDKKNSPGIDEIIYYDKEEDDYVFFADGFSPKMGQFKLISLKNYGYHGYLNVFKYNNDYILYIWRGNLNKDIIIYDSDEWKFIKNSINQTYYFNVINEMESEYKIYIDDGGNIFEIDAGEKIISLFE